MVITVRYRGRKIVVTVPSGDDEIAIDVSSAAAEQKLIVLA